MYAGTVWIETVRRWVFIFHMVSALLLCLFVKTSESDMFATVVRCFMNTE